MSVSVGDIAKQAFDAVGVLISGVVHDANISYSERGDYDVNSGRYSEVEMTVSGRAVIETAAALAKRYPSHVSGPDDTLIILEGFNVVPAVGWKVSIGNTDRTIKRVGDIVGAGELIEVVAA